MNLSALDPDGYVLESVIRDAVGIPDMGVCPNCGVPVGLTELEEADVIPVKTRSTCQTCLHVRRHDGRFPPAPKPERRAPKPRSRLKVKSRDYDTG